MEFIKKNWITIAVVVLIVAIIVYFLRKKKTPAATNTSGAAGRPVTSDSGSKSDLQNRLNECEKNTQGIRLMAGASHPCDSLKDALSKAESSFDGPGTPANNLGKQINIVDYAIGDQGMSMLTESNYNNFKLPKNSARPAASESNYNDAFSSTNGLNVIDFASGMEGTSLLLDKNMKPENSYEKLLRVQ